MSQGVIVADQQNELELRAGSAVREVRPAVSLRPAEASDEIEYVPIAAMAPVSLFFGICSAVGLITVVGLSIGLVGVVLGALALRQIRRAEGALGGRWLARVGCGLSLVCLLGGASLHAYDYATEVPEGHQRISFSWLAKQPIVTVDGLQQVPPAAAELNGKPIFIKGYMLTTRQQHNLSTFVLVKDTGECCFGAQPKLTDMIVVRFKNGKTVNHKEQTVVGVAGIFHAEPMVEKDQVTAIYYLDATHFR